MIDYATLLQTELEGLYTGFLERINQINEWYSIYEGEQEWDTPVGLDYEPTKKITNMIKELIKKRSRFMFGRRPFFDIRPVKDDEEGSDLYKEQAQEKEDLLKELLEKNKFFSKVLKAYRDCCIGGRIAIKLWGNDDEGIKIIFVPAQEFFPQFDVDDVDILEKILFVYALNDESEKENQLIKKQTWEMIKGKCILNEVTVDGAGKIVSTEYKDYDTKLDFIPVIIVQNGGLTGETQGESLVAEIWSNQNVYNHLTSDDVDALRFQMFGQDVITDGAEESLKGIKIAPGAMIDLQSNSQLQEGKQAKVDRLESHFSYKDKFEDTINRIKNDMYSALGVPNIGLDQLKGLMQSGKSMEALYWELMAVCDEDWIEWEDALQEMVDFIFRMIDTYNFYGSREIANYETTLEIIRTYPIQRDENEQKRVDMEEVVTEVRSRESYIDKWSNVESVEIEMEQILKEKQQFLMDMYNTDLMQMAGGDDE